MVKLVLAVMLVSSVASANEIASDPAPLVIIKDEPKPPAKPRGRSLGARFGMMNGALDGHERTFLVIGAQWNFEVVRRVHAIAEYNWLIVMGNEPDPMQTVRGRGHGLRAGGRLTVVDTTIRDDGMLYADLEATGGGAFVSDNIVGPQWIPNVLVGARLGYELWSHEPKSQSSMFGANLLFGALISPGDIGVSFQIGMEWGQRTKH